MIEEMSLDEEESKRQLIETAVLGRQVEDWLKTDIGQYLLARAEERGRIATEKLKVAHVWRKNHIRALQAEIWKCESFREWLNDAMTEGKLALDELEDR